MKSFKLVLSFLHLTTNKRSVVIEIQRQINRFILVVLPQMDLLFLQLVSQLLMHSVCRGKQAVNVHICFCTKSACEGKKKQAWPTSHAFSGGIQILLQRTLSSTRSRKEAFARSEWMGCVHGQVKQMEKPVKQKESVLLLNRSAPKQWSDVQTCLKRRLLQGDRRKSVTFKNWKH